MYTIEDAYDEGYADGLRAGKNAELITEIVDAAIEYKNQCQHGLYTSQPRAKAVLWAAIDEYERETYNGPEE